MHTKDKIKSRIYNSFPKLLIGLFALFVFPFLFNYFQPNLHSFGLNERIVNSIVGIILLIGFIYFVRGCIDLFIVFKLTVFGEKRVPYNELEELDNTYKIDKKLYSGEAFVEKNNDITDEFIFKKGKKILHQRYYENSSSIDFQEEWFCKNINENSEGIINKYQTWHKNGQLAQILIFYKNGKEKETFYNEKGEDTTRMYEE